MIGVQIRVIEPVPDRGENVLPSGGDVGNRGLTLQFPEEILEVAVKIQMNRRNILCPGRIRGPGIFGQSVLPAPAGKALPENSGKLRILRPVLQKFMRREHFVLVDQSDRQKSRILRNRHSRIGIHGPKQLTRKLFHLFSCLGIKQDQRLVVKRIPDRIHTGETAHPDREKIQCHIKTKLLVPGKRSVPAVEFLLIEDQF